MRGARRDRGSSLLEVIAVLPLTIFAVLVGVQLALGVYAAVGAQGAARSAARAATLGRDGDAAARDALDPPLRDRARSVVTRGPTDVVAVVTVHVPRVLPFLPATLFELARSATLPEMTS